MANFALNDPQNALAREEHMIAWLPLRTGWLKMNTDGASHGNPGPATAGGALCDEACTWQGGFAVNIGVCSAPLAELWGFTIDFIWLGRGG